MTTNINQVKDSNLSKLVILIGPKGCGKTTIGKVLGDSCKDIVFLEVEKIFLKVISECGDDVNLFEKPIV